MCHDGPVHLVAHSHQVQVEAAEGLQMCPKGPVHLVTHRNQVQVEAADGLQMCPKEPVHIVAQSHQVAKPNDRRSWAQTRAELRSKRKSSATGPNEKLSKDFAAVVAYSLLFLVLLLVFAAAPQESTFSTTAAATSHVQRHSPSCTSIMHSWSMPFHTTRNCHRSLCGS